MIALEGRLKWRLTAPFHVQLQLKKPLSIPRVAGDVQVQGRVVRVFRTDGRLALGDCVGFVVFACNPGDEPTGPAYIYLDDLTKARYMEIYLYGDPPECELAAYEFTLVSGPSDEPLLTPRELEMLLE
jgi:hypothetical protein